MLNPTPKKTNDSYQLFDYPIIKTERLPRNGDDKDSPLLEFIQRRESLRNFKIIDANVLNKVLWFSAKVGKIDIQRDGYILSSRSSPSAGGRHPIDIIISRPDSKQMEERMFSYYNPFDHSLNLLDLNKQKCNEFLLHINSIVSITDATVIWFVAHSSRTSMKYENCESLIWRDAGALIYCFQLVCTTFDLKSCPIGSLGEPYISELFHKEAGVFGVGGLLLGQ